MNTAHLERFLSRGNAQPSADFVERTRRIMLAEFYLNTPKRVSLLEFLRLHLLQTGLSVASVAMVFVFVVMPVVSPSPQASLDSISFSLETL